MRLYLDNCCYNRPYDSQTSFKVSMETRAKLHIQEEIRQGKYELVTSYMTEYENSQNSDVMKREGIKEYQEEYNTSYVPIERREELAKTVKTLDREGVGRVYLGILDELYTSINRTFEKEARKCAR